ncbi:hypothetical protein J6253_07660 [bacterium]|nr:hypothetical protein [bacterium]MBP5590446.1 hypothetical protein [bacterium]
MKFSALVSVLFICLFFAACASDDDACVTVLDCPNGYSCVDSVCRPPISDGNTDQEVDSDVTTDDSDSDNGEDPELDEFETPIIGDDDPAENPDDITGCPNACSGFGECNFETGVCTCSGNHGGADCSECAEGYHLEAVDDDEDGDGAVSCAVNVKCSSDPCHNNGCREEGDTVKCTCNPSNHLGGRWCEGCAEGYLLNNAGVCKEDCSLKTCPAPQKCGIDPATNEAGCGECENEFYSGANCTSCDTDHFCNGHATACAVENGAEKCTCEAAYTGEKCNTCANGYFQSNGVCVKSCDVNKCFKTHECTGESLIGWEMTGTISGHGTCSNTTGECLCDAGWITGTSSLGTGTTVQCGALVSVFETLNNVECTICDKNNPPSQYASSGCPQELTGDTSLCNSIYSLTFCGMSGSCYYEPTGSHQLYCVCSSGYHLDNGDKYTGYCVADE